MDSISLQQNKLHEMDVSDYMLCLFTSNKVKLLATSSLAVELVRYSSHSIGRLFKVLTYTIKQGHVTMQKTLEVMQTLNHCHESSQEEKDPDSKFLSLCEMIIKPLPDPEDAQVRLNKLEDQELKAITSEVEKYSQGHIVRELMARNMFSLIEAVTGCLASDQRKKIALGLEASLAILAIAAINQAEPELQHLKVALERFQKREHIGLQDIIEAQRNITDPHDKFAKGRQRDIFIRINQQITKLFPNLHNTDEKMLEEFLSIGLWETLFQNGEEEPGPAVSSKATPPATNETTKPKAPEINGSAGDGSAKQDPNAQMITIVQFDEQSRRASLDDTSLLEVIDSEIMDLPTRVISLGGVARSGKSFLFCLLVNYLEHVEKAGNDDDGWEKSTTPLTGVKWAQSKKAVTLGICMWKRPFVLNRPDGIKIAVLLIDCQGTGDNLNKSDTSLDTLIMLLSLQLSSVQVLNVRGYLSCHDISSLQTCAESAKLKISREAGEQVTPVFKSLIVATRDYGGSEVGEDGDLFHDTKMKASNTDGNTVGIDEAFQSIKAYNFPYPGREVAFASAGSEWSPSKVPEEFCKVAKLLFQSLCDTKPGKEGEQLYWSSAREIISHFQAQKKWLETEDLPQTKSSSEALKDGLLLKEFKDKQEELTSIQKKLNSPEELGNIESEDQLKEKYELEVEQVIKAFQRHRHDKSRDGSVEKYVERLYSIRDSLYSDLRNEFELFETQKKLQTDQEKHRKLAAELENLPPKETTEN